LIRLGNSFLSARDVRHKNALLSDISRDLAKGISRRKHLTSALRGEVQSKMPILVLIWC
jgi:hypothetical protein